MNRRAVIKRIQKQAKRQGVRFQQKELTNHTGLIVGDVRTTIGRHSEIREGDAEALYRQLEPAFGKGWWRK